MYQAIMGPGQMMSSAILGQSLRDQQEADDLAMASTLDVHAGQMFPNRKAAQDLAQRMAGVNTAGNFLRDLGAARLGTTQAARMGRLDPAEMLREKLVGHMAGQMDKVGKDGGPGSMADVFQQMNPAFSLMGGQPYEPRRDPLAFMSNRDDYARMLGFLAAQNGQAVDSDGINQVADRLFAKQSQGRPSNAAGSVSEAASMSNGAFSSPLFRALGITPDTSAATISSIIKNRTGGGSPLNDEELRQIASHAKNMEMLSPGWSSSGPVSDTTYLKELLGFGGDVSPSKALEAFAPRARSKRFSEGPFNPLYQLQYLLGY